VDERVELEVGPGVNEEVEVGGVNDEVDVGVYVELEVGGVKELNEVLITCVPVRVDEGVT
jgi:hypothetical protein